MISLLFHLVAVTVPVEASVPRLILSARVTRGYAPEDRCTPIKTIDALVDSIPLFGRRYSTRYEGDYDWIL